MKAWGQELTADDRRWLDWRWSWLIDQFGTNFNREIVLTEPEYFPDGYHYDESSVERYLRRVCDYMDVDRERIQLHYYEESPDVVVRDRSRTTAGLYIESNDHFQIWIETKQIADPLALVATLAHELAHVRLLGERRVSPEVFDHELLTDLLTIYLGMGVFTANSAIREAYWQEGNYSGWQMSRQGYLPMPMLGYALALLASSRGEGNPPWLRYLRSDVRSHFKQSMKLIQSAGESSLWNQGSDKQFLSRYARRISGKLTTLRPKPKELDSNSSEPELSQPTCYYCGAEVTDDSEVCLDCQESIDANTEELMEEQYENPKKHQKSLVWILFVGLGCMICWTIYEELFGKR